MISNRALNELRVGYASYGINQVSLTDWSKHWQAANGITTDGPRITFRGFSFHATTTCLATAIRTSTTSTTTSRCRTTPRAATI